MQVVFIGCGLDGEDEEEETLSILEGRRLCRITVIVALTSHLNDG